MSKFRKKARAGFTLLEIMIVLVIMGFLVAMIAPRLSGIGDSAIDTVCDTNNRGVRYFAKMFQLEKSRLPNKPITIVNADLGGTTNPLLPVIEDEDADTGAETLCHELVVRNKPYLHILSVDEADEIVGLGIKKMAVLNDLDGSVNGHTPQAFTGRPMEMVDVQAGLPVLMIGAGDTDGDGAIALTESGIFADFANYNTQIGSTDASLNDYHGNPYWMYRIMVGVGPDSELISEGMLQNAALCPGGIARSDNVVYNYYCLILPRLEATIDSLATGSPVEITVEDEGMASGAGRQLVLKFEAQESWEFDATCPEGHKWPDNEEDMWTLVSVDSTK